MSVEESLPSPSAQDHLEADIAFMEVSLGEDGLGGAV